jgi:hypothetical protein
LKKDFGDLLTKADADQYATGLKPFVEGLQERDEEVQEFWR